MKKMISVVATLFFAITILAQENHNTSLGDNYYDKTQPGFILTLDGLKIPCEIQLSHPAAIGDRLILTKSAGGRSEWASNDLAGFLVNGDLWVSRPIGGINNRYCRVIEEGPIMIFEDIMYVKEGDNKMKRTSQLLSYQFVQKGDAKPKMWATISLNVSKHLGPMVSDNAEIKAQVEKEGVTITDETIKNYIKSYNESIMVSEGGYILYRNTFKEKETSERKHPIAGTDLNDALSKLTKGKKVSLAEKVAKTDKIPVYFMKQTSNVQCDGFGPTGTAIPKADWEQSLDASRKDDLMNFIIAELNFLFKTDKFVNGNDYPGKKFDFAGQGIDFYVKHQIYGRYSVSDLNSKNLYDIKYKLYSNIGFMELNEKGKWKSAKRIEFSKDCKKTSSVKLYSLKNFVNFIPLDCPVDVLKEDIQLKEIKWIKKQFPNG